jgi:RNA polymerase sigma-70 factor (ECF subfamily)
VGEKFPDELTRLLLAARDGDRVALAGFVRATQPEVARLCRWLGDPSGVDDLAQDTYERALRSLPRFRAESSARTWLLTIARRTAADAVRTARRRRRAIDGPAPVSEPDHAGRVAVEALVAGLDPDRRAAFVLTQVIGLSYAETAAVCGTRVGTIRSRVARARHDLVAGAAEATA